MIQRALVVALVALAGVPAVHLPETLVRLWTRAGSGNSSMALPLALTIGTLFIVVLGRSARMAFLSTLQHELSHLAFALALGCVPSTLRVGQGRGEIQYRIGSRLAWPRCFLISIAPYWFSPLVLVPILLCGLSGDLGTWWRSMLGCLTGISLALPLDQWHPRQTDLKRHGLVLPLFAAGWLWAGLAVVTISAIESFSLASTLAIYRDCLRLLWP